jgi:hypothetical protein
MGQSGVELGLALYESWEQFAAILSEALPYDQMSAFSLMYGESLQISDIDLAAQEKQGWEVAGPEAYPCILRIRPGMELVEPTPHELSVLELCLKALPPFVRNPKNSHQQVVLHNQPLDVELCYFEDGRAVPPR